MATTSPRRTPRDLSTLAKHSTSDGRSAYEMVRLSPGSPSQWKATRSPSPAATGRSRQLYETLSVPPVNQRAKGSSHSSTLSQGENQSREAACSAQKASGSATAFSYIEGSG